MTRCERRRARLIAGVLLQSAVLVTVELPGAAAATVPLPTLRPVAEAGLPAGVNVPIPEPRPDDIALSRIVSNADLFTLRAALKAIRDSDFAAARSARAALRAPIARSLVDWLRARDSARADHAEIAAFLRAHPDWPNRDILRARMETALFDARPRPADVVAAFDSAPPETGPGKAALALALIQRGDKATAAKWARDAWENHTLSPAQEGRIAADFSGILTKENHKARLDRQLFADRIAAAERTAKRLGGEAVALTRARAAVSRRSNNAGKLLAGLSAENRKEPVALLSRIQWLRRAGKDAEAAKLMLTAPRQAEAANDVWQWWEERRILTRRLLDRGDAETAYRIAAGHAAESGLAFAEGEFLAGWVALRYLDKPQTALTHFEALRQGVSTDLSLSRAHYWLGRGFEALGRVEEARSRYRDAARFDTAYYGQLARLKLGEPAHLAIAPTPQPTAEEQRRFFDREPVRAARLLGELGEAGFAGVFLTQLAYSLDSTAEIARAGRLARDLGMPHVALRIGKIAVARGRPLAGLAFLTGAIPDLPPRGDAVEPALLHAVARQESGFDTAAVSPAGARGLMQLMPATAKQTAREAGLAYSPARLTDDPAYNATVGASHLKHLIATFDGSYIMTFAAYNAGPRRVRQWVETFGDPRDGNVDPIDWVERIPFSETRNYVQRVLENLQVYRARLNGDTHPIELVADLTRARRQ
jgi:soluble lytic murein transglycosylase